MPTREIQQRRSQLEALFNERAPIARLFGMRLAYEGEAAVFHMPYNPDLDHALGQTHGGAVATLLDNAGWFTAAPYFDRWIATVELSVRLHEPVARQELTARGRIVRRGKRIVSAEMEVRGEQAQLIATGSGTFTVTSAIIRGVEG